MSEFVDSLRSNLGKAWNRTKIAAEIAKLKLTLAKHDS